ncbi:uncharacterized protein VTP21DRAFT_7978 [Calcarisporiella thermophila]|uniref:uncharacterized protein n=1 Tax=Calcarisporiella thermophila TaxID=911321 RepID=UPI00374461E7
MLLPSSSLIMRHRIRHSLISYPASLPRRPYSSKFTPSKYRNRVALPLILAVAGGSYYAYHHHTPTRHTVTAVWRCTYAGYVGSAIALDYKLNFWKKFGSEVEERENKRRVHKRSAERVLEGCKRLGGIYIKLGQHLSAMQYILPPEWTKTLAPLQDRCPATPFQEVEQLFLSDLGQSLQSLFSHFDPIPIGVASLAQVHRARLRDTDQLVAVKIQHPHLDEYCRVDLAVTTQIIEFVRWAFPEFEFGWLAEEMNTSLPVEMDFRCEAENARRVQRNFAGARTSLKVPDVLWAQRRILCMEFIEGGRIDNLEYLQEHKIDVNKVSLELARIFSEMIYLQGYVHCDPHPGNLLIRPSQPSSHSPHNFEIVLLDHGLYRDLPPQFRVNYAHLWTAIIRGSEEEIAYYSRQVGGTEAHRLFACILTGRDWAAIGEGKLTDGGWTEAEAERIREGAAEYALEIVELLAKVPRLLLLLFKTNDLLRSVDVALRTTHGDKATIVVMARFCAAAVFEDCNHRVTELIQTRGLQWSVLREWCGCLMNYWSVEMRLFAMAGLEWIKGLLSLSVARLLAF